MGSLWSELQQAISRLNFLFATVREMKRDIAYLSQQLRDARGR